MQLDMDFIRDVRLGLEVELQELGYTPPTPTGNEYEDAHRVCVIHWNAHARRIPAKPRVVHWSRELLSREPGLSADLRRGLATVQREIEAGDDLAARLSRRLPRRDFHDLMLNDWAIQHLHLDPVDRTRGTLEVLFLLARPDHAYFVDVRGHGAWADAELVEIIHANWPDQIEQFRSRATGLTHALTDAQRRNLRARRANSAIQLKDGSIYQAMGGGYASSGANMKAVIWGDYTLKTARLVEDHLRGQAEWVKEFAERDAGVSPDHVTLRLLGIERDHAVVLVQGSRVGFRVPIEEPPRVTVNLSTS